MNILKGICIIIAIRKEIQSFLNCKINIFKKETNKIDHRSKLTPNILIMTINAKVCHYPLKG